MEFLRARGYLVVDRNWRSGHHELDIVATTPDGSYHFVEVKTRKAGGLTSPEEAIDRNKQKTLKRAASLFLATYDVSLEPQFDLIAVDHWPDGQLDVRYVPDVVEFGW